jgi:hypothetical protein
MPHPSGLDCAFSLIISSSITAGLKADLAERLKRLASEGRLLDH